MHDFEDPHVVVVGGRSGIGPAVAPPAQMAGASDGLLGASESETSAGVAARLPTDRLAMADTASSEPEFPFPPITPFRKPTMTILRHRLVPITLAIALGSAAMQTLAQSGPAAASHPQLAATVQRLADESAIRNLIYHYGRGNDAVAIHYADRALARQRGAAEYAKAFAPDIRIEVFALGGDKPIGQITGIPAWTEFADKYYDGNGYSSTLHLMSNFEIGFDGADRADVTAYALAPHFFVRAAARDKASADTAVEWMIARYAYQAQRQRDGSWKIARLQINLEEISRAAGFFPGGQRNGR